jgi:hypothetical protein
MGRYYQGTREDRRRREVRILSERLARHEANAAAHPESPMGRMAAHAADAVRQRLQDMGQAQTRREYLRG